MVMCMYLPVLLRKIMDVWLCSIIWAFDTRCNAALLTFDNCESEFKNSRVSKISTTPPKSYIHQNKQKPKIFQNYTNE